MTMRERLLAVFRGERTDVIPWYPDLGHWHECHASDGTLDERYLGDEGFVRLYQDLGAGMFLFLEGVWRVEYEGVSLTSREDGDAVISEIATPVGKLRSVYRYSSAAQCWGPVERMIKSVDDLRPFRYFLEHRRFSSYFDLYRHKDDLWGDQGLPVVFVPGSPIGMFITSWAGIEVVSMLIEDTQEELEMALEALARSDDGLYQAVAESPAVIVEMGENMSGELVGGLFREYGAPYYRQRAKELHGAGKYVSTHLDGTLSGILSQLADTGIDCAEAVTPAPVGDIALRDLRAAAGDGLIIWGGVPGAMFAPPFAWADMEEHISELLDCHRYDGRFVVGSADEVPPDGEVQFIRKIADMLEADAKAESCLERSAASAGGTDYA